MVEMWLTSAGTSDRLPFANANAGAALCCGLFHDLPAVPLCRLQHGLTGVLAVELMGKIAKRFFSIELRDDQFVAIGGSKAETNVITAAMELSAGDDDMRGLRPEITPVPHQLLPRGNDNGLKSHRLKRSQQRLLVLDLHLHRCEVTHQQEPPKVNGAFGRNLRS